MELFQSDLNKKAMDGVISLDSEKKTATVPRCSKIKMENVSSMANAT